jgi:acetyl/propionyl-CoA carboxylase alpha subunit
MPFQKLLIANRGEIAIRIARAAADLGIRSVAVFSEDDAQALHVKLADEARALKGSGPASYLDMAQAIAAAKEAGCDCVHPGYGFLSENAEFATRCAKAGLTFIGPSPAVLSVFGDKARARALADKFGVPILKGTSGPTSLEDVRAFFKDRGAIIIKAIAGGGGRGMRIVTDASQLDEAYARCRSEAKASFGIEDVYVEAFMANAHHIEVQVAGDGKTAVHLWERDCTIQRRHQKIVEIAPAPFLDEHVRKQLFDAAVWLAEDVDLRGLATFEFLVDPHAKRGTQMFAFIEANPRLQVEHTVTEEVTGIDLVTTQIRLLQGATLEELGLKQNAVPKPQGVAIQLRVNLESLGADGGVKPSGGVLSQFAPPSGPGVRVDASGYAGYRTNPSFDPLIAKLIVHGADFAQARSRGLRALTEFAIAGAQSNIGFLHALLENGDVAAGRAHTRFVEENLPSLLKASQNWKPLHVAPAQVEEAARTTVAAPAGTLAVTAPMQAKIVSIEAAPGAGVITGEGDGDHEQLKMQPEVGARVSGRVE